MRKWLVLLGLVLVGVAGTLGFWLVPMWERIPFFMDTTSDLEGEVRLLENFPVDRNQFPLAVHMHTWMDSVSGDNATIKQETYLTTALSEQDAITQVVIKTFLKYVVINRQYWDKIELVFGDREILNEFEIDRRKGTYQAGDSRDGAQWVFPLFDIGTSDYQFWESNTDSPLKMRYKGEDEVDGNKVYVYRGDFGVAQLGEVTIPWVEKTVMLNSDGRLTLWVDQETGIIVDVDFEFEAFARWLILRFDILSIRFQPTAEYKAHQLSLARNVYWLWQLGKIWVPIGLTVAGVGMVVLGFRKKRKSVD